MTVVSLTRSIDAVTCVLTPRFSHLHLAVSLVYVTFHSILLTCLVFLSSCSHSLATFGNCRYNSLVHVHHLVRAQATIISPAWSFCPAAPAAWPPLRLVAAVGPQQTGIPLPHCSCVTAGGHRHQGSGWGCVPQGPSAADQGGQGKDYRVLCFFACVCDCVCLCLCVCTCVSV
jgi:hypothetical protein